MPTSFVYFDFGNVICHFSHDRMRRQMAEVSGAAPDRVAEVLLDRELQYAFEEGATTATEFFDAYCERIGASPDRDALSLAFNDIFSVNDLILPLLGRLASHGNRLGVLSNTNAAHWDFIFRERFASLMQGPFEQIVLSYEERSMKPDPTIYEVAITRAGVPAGEVFFVDDREENIDGARRMGIDAVLFESVDQLEKDLRGRGVPGA